MRSLSTYQYDLPGELVARYPCVPRDSSRLMVLDRASGNISEAPFYKLPTLLSRGDSLVFNDTKVIPARLIGKKQSGATIEIFLTEQLDASTWQVLAKPSKKLSEGTHVFFSPTFSCTVLPSTERDLRRVRFNYEGNFEEALAAHGRIPLPHYIDRPQEKPLDKASYQTVYATHPGAVAAPTAGLHFTEDLLDRLSHEGVGQTHITLHVGIGTFKPVLVDDITQHRMHAERYTITPEAAVVLNSRSDQSRQVCVGTTCCRTLEAAANHDGIIQPGTGTTDIFIYPGYEFKYVQGLLTNFHLPRSTLLMLVCAFGGYDLVMEAYQKAIEERFRFYSYGDAMLIL